MNSKSSFLLLGIAVLCFSCASPNKLTKTISIESDPPGLRVEVNNGYLGETPTTYKVETNPEGEFLGSWVNAPQIEFNVTPPANLSGGLFKQKKVFTPNGFFKAGDKIPERIFFDMHQKP